MAAPPIRAVLFDFGNTLFAHAPLADTVLAGAATAGHEIDAPSAAALAARIDARAAGPSELAFGRDLDRTVWAARWRAIYALDDDRFPGLGAAIDASMHDPRAWVPFATTPAVLAGLHESGVRVGVVSNTGWDVRLPFAVRGLDAAVDAFTLSCEVGVAKPDPAIFAAACAALDAEPHAVLMVGDDARTDVGGMALGLRTLLLPPGPPGSDNGIGAVPHCVLGGDSTASAPAETPTG